MTINILCITDPADYPQTDAEVPIFYRHLTRVAGVSFHHAFTHEVSGNTWVSAVNVPRNLDADGFAALGRLPRQRLHAASFDVAFCRSKKPFPPDYLDRLGVWAGYMTFLNDPLAKKEQIAPGFLKKVARGFIPDMIVTGNADEVLEFLDRHGTIVLKRPNSTGGLGVYRLERTDGGIYTDHVRDGRIQHPSIAHALAWIGEEKLEVVRYLPAVSQGDKRIVVVDGKIYGAYVRRSVSGHWVNNLSSGACDVATAEITPFERAAIAATAPEYLARGLRTLGYDFLMDRDGHWKISEINAGNIGGLVRLEQLTGEPVLDRFVGWMMDVSDGLAPPLAVNANLHRMPEAAGCCCQ